MIQIPKAQKAQGRLHHNTTVDPQKEPGEQYIIQVWKNMAENDVSPAVSLNHAVFDKWLGIKVNDLGADIPGRPYPAECSNQQNQVPAGASQKGRQHDHGHQLRKQHENIDNAIGYPRRPKRP